MKLAFKDKATDLRNRGYSYSEIIKQVPVSKSTLSLWLRSIELSHKQKSRLKRKFLKNLPLGSKALKTRRIERSQEIIRDAIREIKSVSKRNLWLMGIMLYWAEGSKQKEHQITQRVAFSNSDPLMIKLYIKWLKICLEISADRIFCEIYLHDNNKKREKEILSYWVRLTRLSSSKFDKIYYKKDTKNNFRKNRGKNYHGLVRVKVLRSTDLNRKIAGWIQGICIRCRVV